MRFKAAFAALALALTGIAPAAAQNVVFSQDPTGQACDTTCWISLVDLSTFDTTVTADNFILSADANIFGAAWAGFYFDSVTPSNNPVLPSTSFWATAILPDDGGGKPDINNPVVVDFPL